MCFYVIQHSHISKINFLKGESESNMLFVIPPVVVPKHLTDSKRQKYWRLFSKTNRKSCRLSTLKVQSTQVCRTKMQLIKTVIFAGSAIAGSLLTGLYVLQERILYHPSIPCREYDCTPDRFGLPYEDAEIITDDNVKLHAWLIKQNLSKNSPTFIYFHGNAGNISHR